MGASHMIKVLLCSYGVRHGKRTSNYKCPGSQGEYELELTSALQREIWGSSAMTMIDEAERMKEFPLVQKIDYALSDIGPSNAQEPNNEACYIQALHSSPCDSQLCAQSIRKFQQAYLKFAGPILNCHTCSYMNDQGKCLRGEGVCSTQNSQQCMLKKIFEGMWGLHDTIFARETHIN